MKTLRLCKYGGAVALVILIAVAGCSDEKSMPVEDPTPSSVPIEPFDRPALFVVNGRSNSISVVDVSTNEVAGTIALVNVVYPHHAYFDADQSAVVVAAPGHDLSAGHGGHGSDTQGAVLVLDAETGMTRTARRLDYPNHNALPSPDGDEIWTALMSSPGAVLVLDRSTLLTLHTIPVGDMPSEVTFNSDGRYAFVANTNSASVTVIDVGTKEQVTTIPVGEGPVGAWPGVNGVMYVDNEHGESVTAIDGSTLEIVGTYDLGFTPGMAVVAPNGELWVTDTELGAVVFFRSDEDVRLGDLPTGAGAHAIAFNENGSTAYVSNQSAGSVTAIDVATHSVLETISVGAQPNGLLFRP